MHRQGVVWRMLGLASAMLGRASNARSRAPIADQGKPSFEDSLLDCNARRICALVCGIALIATSSAPTPK
eukprot:4597262-Pyramimonas_sp.AAC.1